VERAHVVGHDWGAAVAWGLGALAGDRVDHLVALSVGHPATFRAGGFEQYEKSWYMLLFQFTPEGESWVTEEHLRDWAHHPDASAVHAELVRNGSITAGLNYYRANVPPAALVGPPLELPPIQSPAMGIWSSADFALLEQQMAASSEFCAGGWRYERVEGAGHWFQWEQPDRVNALLIDFLPA
jgi:pimeloyl-ACP methyl ester carboxylesterase